MNEIRIVEELNEGAVQIYDDGRGEIGDFRRFLVGGLHVVTMQPGAMRGNHIHDRDEIICVIGGGNICEITAKDEVSRYEENIIVAGNIKTYRIKAGVKHIVKNTGNDLFYLVCFHEAMSRSPET